MEKTALIANGTIQEYNVIKGLVQQHKTIIAVDGGLNHCVAMGIIPDIAIGDFDSATPEAKDASASVSFVEFPQKKDQTDLELALLYAIEKLGARTITLFGALGGRFDHTLANLCLLAMVEEDIDIAIEDESQKIFLLAKRQQIATTPGQTLSLMPIFGKVKNVSTQGLKWELYHTTLSKDSFSVSNIAIGNTFSITKGKGHLLCCLNKQ
ncbi:thiamine diphosphokinase [Simkania negevensis]|uniref:Thiamine diphosphokinase n=1 Tax=Simkania negevensis TaxID=83561 RepID=A0ABS3ASJ8_9BACT|nr:thiamine diphosphokinase [Simkania negevensis]